MTDDPIDFSRIDPEQDRDHFEEVMHRIRVAASPELARRRLRQSLWGQLFEWRTPVVATAVAVILAVLGAAQFTNFSETTDTGEDDLSAALGVPAPLASWIVADTLPATVEVLFPATEVNE